MTEQPCLCQNSAPDLLGQVLVPAELLGQDLGADLGVVARAYPPLVDRLCQAVLNWPRLSHNNRHEFSIMPSFNSHSKTKAQHTSTYKRTIT